VNGRVGNLLNGGQFDVALARKHARSMVAMADVQDVFENWCRDKGLGPENRKCGAFVGATRT
jgi:hypothetical protein